MAPATQGDAHTQSLSALNSEIARQSSSTAMSAGSSGSRALLFFVFTASSRLAITLRTLRFLVEDCTVTR